MSSVASDSNTSTSPSAFRYDTSDVEWRDFITPGCYYKLLHVNVDVGQADMIVKFEPNSECIYHRHAATTTTMVLEGELRVREQTDGREVVRVKRAGSYSIGGEGEVHIEGAGDERAIIFFSMRTNGDVIYELLNPDPSLRKAITIADFDRDWKEKWPEQATVAV